MAIPKDRIGHLMEIRQNLARSAANNTALDRQLYGVLAELSDDAPFLQFTTQNPGAAFEFMQKALPISAANYRPGDFTYAIRRTFSGQHQVTLNASGSGYGPFSGQSMDLSIAILIATLEVLIAQGTILLVQTAQGVDDPASFPIAKRFFNSRPLTTEG